MAGCNVDSFLKAWRCKDCSSVACAIVVLGANVLRVPETTRQVKGSNQQRVSLTQQRRETPGLCAGAGRRWSQSSGAEYAGIAAPRVWTPNDRWSFAAAGGTAAQGTSSAGTPIAQVSAVPVNSSVTFTVPSTGDPGCSFIFRIHNSWPLTLFAHMPVAKWVTIQAVVT